MVYGNNCIKWVYYTFLLFSNIAYLDKIYFLIKNINFIVFKYALYKKTNIFKIITIKNCLTRCTYSRHVEIYPLRSTMDAMNMFRAIEAKTTIKNIFKPVICELINWWIIYLETNSQSNTIKMHNDLCSYNKCVIFLIIIYRHIWT